MPRPETCPLGHELHWFSDNMASCSVPNDDHPDGYDSTYWLWRDKHAPLEIPRASNGEPMAEGVHLEPKPPGGYPKVVKKIFAGPEGAGEVWETVENKDEPT